MKLLLTILIFFSYSAGATTYYIDFTWGLDANNGTSTATPWKTIAKINSSTFAPGDFILFKRGQMWREQLTIPSSGSAGLPITFGAYGNGAKPIINGADITTGWTTSATNVWWTTSPNATTTRAMVIIDGVIYAEVASVALVNSANEYFIDVTATPDRLYVFSTTDPDNLVAEVSKRNYGFIARDQDDRHHCSFIGLEFRYAGTTGLQLEGEYQGPQVQGNFIVDSCFFYANRAAGCDAHDGVTDNVFKNSVATYNGNGFYAWISDNVTMQNCSTAHNINYQSISLFTDGHGFGVYAGDNFVIENCESNDDAGGVVIDAGNAANGGIIRYNYLHNSTTFHPGISTGNLATGDTIEIYYNLVVNCGGTTGTGMEDYLINTGTTLVYNNTFYNNTLNGGNSTIYFTYGNGMVFKNNIVMSERGDFKTLLFNQYANLLTSDYNQWFQLDSVNSPARFYYNGTYRNTLANWQAGVGQDLNSQSGNPLFVNKASNWHLLPGSPAINKGVNVGLTRDKEGRPIVGLPDMGAFEYSASRQITVTGEKMVAMNNGTRGNVRPDSLFDGNTTTRVCISDGSGDNYYFPNTMMYFFDSLFNTIKVRVFTGNGSPSTTISLYSKFFKDTLTVNLINGVVQGWQYVDSATTKAWVHDVWAMSVYTPSCIDVRELEVTGISAGVKAAPWYPNSTAVLNTPHREQNGMNLLGNEPYSLIRIAGALRLNGATWYYDTTYYNVTLGTHQFDFSRFGALTTGKLIVWADSGHMVTIYTQAPSAANMPVPRPYDPGIPEGQQYDYYNAYSLYKNIIPGSDSTLGASWVAEHRLAGAVAITFGSNASVDSTRYTIRLGGGGSIMAKGLNYVKYIEIGNEDARDWNELIYYHSPPVRIAKIGGVKDTATAKDPNFKIALGANPYWDTNDVKSIALQSMLARGIDNVPFHVYVFNTYCTNVGGQSQASNVWGVSPENFQLYEKNSAIRRVANKYLGPVLVWHGEIAWASSDSSIYRAKVIGTKSIHRVKSDWEGRARHLNRLAGIDGTYHYRLLDETNNLTTSQGFLTTGAYTGYNGTNPDSSFAAWPLARIIEFEKIYYDRYAGPPQLIKHGDSTSLWVIRDNPELGDSITTFTFWNAGETTLASFQFDPGQTITYVRRLDVDYGTVGDDINNGSGAGIASTPTLTANRIITMDNVGGTYVTVQVKLGPLKEKIRYGRGAKI